MSPHILLHFLLEGKGQSTLHTMPTMHSQHTMHARHQAPAYNHPDWTGSPVVACKADPNTQHLAGRSNPARTLAAGANCAKSCWELGILRPRLGGASRRMSSHLRHSVSQHPLCPKTAPASPSELSPVEPHQPSDDGGSSGPSPADFRHGILLHHDQHHLRRTATTHHHDEYCMHGETS